jgi:hypothetical protein
MLKAPATSHFFGVDELKADFPNEKRLGIFTIYAMHKIYVVHCIKLTYLATQLLTVSDA